YSLFDSRYDVHASNGPQPGTPHLQLRQLQVPVYVCPADPSSANYLGYGVSNYFGNLGASASTQETNPAYAGIFNVTIDNNGNVTNKVRIGDIRDGTSNTALFAEVKRSTLSPADTGTDDQTVFLRGSSGFNTLQWDPGCATAQGGMLTYTGLQYYRSLA